MENNIYDYVQVVDISDLNISINGNPKFIFRKEDGSGNYPIIDENGNCQWITIDKQEMDGIMVKWLTQ